MKGRREPFSLLQHKADLSQNEVHLEVDRVFVSTLQAHATIPSVITNQALWRRTCEFWSLPMNELVLKVPCDPWQMFKHCYFPAWLLRVFPVRYVNEIYTLRMCFPESAQQCAENLKRHLGEPIPLFRHELTDTDEREPSEVWNRIWAKSARIGGGK